MNSRGDRRPRVVVGVGGGIAAYKSCEIIRRLADAEVTVVPTAAALEFVGTATFEALSGRAVHTGVFTDVPAVNHVRTGQQADLVVVAPATADLMSRVANGAADDLLTSTLLVTRAPVLFAPAMHTEMWTHPATVANVATLRARGNIVMPPAVGRLTGPDSGPGRLPEPEHIVDLAHTLLVRPEALPYDLAGLRVVITAGGTREELDPVRFLGNRSSGRQGFALALVAAARGAEVTIIAANVELAAPPGVRVVPVGDAHALQEAVTAEAESSDVIVMAAAVADFRPAVRQESKIKKVGDLEPDALALVRNPDILAGLTAARVGKSPFIVGFAAETGDATADVLTYGRDKLRRKGCDLLVVNRVDGGRGFGSADNAAVILDPVGESTEVPFGPKTVLASILWDLVSAKLTAED